MYSNALELIEKGVSWPVHVGLKTGEPIRAGLPGMAGHSLYKGITSIT